MKHITLVMPYYLNPVMLAYQYNVWGSYADDVKDKLDIVIVDDGSPDHHAADVPRPNDLPRLSIYRVQVDIPWNQHGARNLGAHVAEGPWLLMTDMDHVVPEDTLRTLLTLKNERRVYTFFRVDAHTMEPTCRPDGSFKAHPNSFALTREAYWNVGGYDEDFCGMYGTDGLFRRRLYSQYKQTPLEDAVIIRYGREVIPDASTTTLERRKDGSVKGETRRRMEWKASNGRTKVIATLQFPWQRVV